MENIRKIKGLKTQLNQLNADADILKIQISNNQKELSSKLNSIKQINSEIEKLNQQDGIRVSEHAIVRYLERVKGLDIEQIQSEILTDSILKLIEVLGVNGTYPNNGFSVVIRNNTVTTIL
jgi:hypothetical protein